MAVSEDGETLVSAGRDKVGLILDNLWIMLRYLMLLCAILEFRSWLGADVSNDFRL